MPISPEVRALRERLVAVRRDLHRHPELGFEETRTAGIVAARLRELGLEPKEGIAKTGVTALLEGGAARGDGAGRTVLVRADMDALPIEEANDVPYRSAHPGRMHACGHDGHTSVALGLAELLVAERDDLRGRVVLLFQPAEEGPGGAEPMIGEGVLEDPPVEAAIGLHLSTMLPVGKVAVASGPVMAAIDRFTIRITARGGHGAKPQETGDPVVAAAHVITALQTIVSRDADPLEPAVVTIGTVHGGSAVNVIPSEVELGGSIRTYDPDLRATIPRRLEEISVGVARALRCEAELRVEPSYPATVNDEAMAALVRDAAIEVVGAENVLTSVRGMWSEDFAYYGQHVPACFFFVGARNEARGLVYPHHSDRFDFDEDALPIGVEVFRGAIRRFLG